MVTGITAKLLNYTHPQEQTCWASLSFFIGGNGKGRGVLIGGVAFTSVLLLCIGFNFLSTELLNNLFAIFH